MENPQLPVLYQEADSWSDANILMDGLSGGYGILMIKTVKGYKLIMIAAKCPTKIKPLLLLVPLDLIKSTFKMEEYTSN